MAAERQTYGQWSLNGGELSKRLQGRVDQEIYQVSTAEMVGYVPLVQGPAVAAPGTIFVAQAKGPCRLFPFEYNPTQGYAVEASQGTFRFYTNNARIDTGPGVAFELVHPWDYDELFDLAYCQSADVLYLTGAGKRPKKLARTDAVNFELDDFNLDSLPIDTGNSDEGLTVTIVNTGTNACNVVASAALFDPLDNSCLFEIECLDINVPSWEPGIDINATTHRSWGGRVYAAGATGRTGSVPPEHDHGTEYDGMSSGLDVNGKGPYGVPWEYLYSRVGLVRFTGYVSPTVMQALIIKPIATSVQTTGTWLWAFGAFSDRKGWPDTVGLWNDCLVLTKDNRVFTSVIGDYENFGSRDSSGDFQRDLAGSLTLPSPAKIRWQATDRYLLLGTDTAEYTVERVQVQTGTPGPPVFDIRLQSSNGSSAVRPIQADGRMLFVQRAGRKLREMGYAIANDRYLAPDVTRLADHIGKAGFVDLAWQAEPERLVWAALGDGKLAAMTYEPSQEVKGWCRRELGGGLFARSACRITDPDGKRDQTWLAGDAFADGVWILRMDKMWEQGDDRALAFLVDAGLSYDGAAVDTFSGLDHLEGREVDILADGKTHRRLTVSGGEVTLDYAAAKAVIGLPFPAYIDTLPPEAGQSEGTAQGKLKRILELGLYVLEAAGLQVTVQDGIVIPVELRTSDDAMNQAVPLYSGLIRIPTIGSYDRLGKVRIERVEPQPSTICAIIPAIEVGEM